MLACVCESDLEQVSALKPRAQCFRRFKVLKPRVQDHMENHSVCVCVCLGSWGGQRSRLIYTDV